MSSTTATSTPFPLLHLPSLAINEFFKLTGPYEQFQLSFVSKKTKNIVKKFVKRLRVPFNLKLKFRDSYYSIIFRRSTNSTEKLIVESEKIKGSNPLKSLLQFDDVDVPVDYSYDNYGRHIVTTYWKDKIDGMKYLLRHFSDVFNLSISLVTRHQEEHLVSELLSKLQDSRIDYFELVSKNSSVDLYQKILDLSCEEVCLFTNPSSDFRYRNSMMPMKFSRLRIYGAHWVKLDDLLHCKTVKLLNTNVKPNEFNQFLKKWLQSDFQLEYLQVKMNYSTFTSIFDEIPVTRLQQASIGHEELSNFEDGHCFELQRNNGKKAVVLYEKQFGAVTLKTNAYRFF